MVMILYFGAVLEIFQHQSYHMVVRDYFYIQKLVVYKV